MKNAVRRTLLIVSILLSVSLSGKAAFAQSTRSQIYKLQNENIDIETPENITPESMQDHLDPLSVSQLKNQGYVVLSSADELADTLQIDVANTNIDLGSFDKGDVLKSSVNFQLKSSQPHVFEVSVLQLNPFETLLGEKLENTTCDNPSNPCTDKIAKSWTLPSIAGIGYTVNGLHTPTDFKNGQFFRIFPQQSQGDVPADISFNPHPLSEDKVNFTIKLQASPDKKEGTYNSVINIAGLTAY